MRVVARMSEVDGPREGEAVFIDAEPRHRQHFDVAIGKRVGWRESQPDEEALLAFLFLLPALVLLGVFVFYPLGRTIWLGLYCGGGFSGEKTYVGVQQYWDVFQSNEFRHSLGVTFLFALITVPAGLAIGLGLAVLADKHLRGMHFFRTAFSRPSPRRRRWPR